MSDEDFSDALQTVSQANLFFTSDMYRVLAEGDGNLVFSPWSIQVILALAFLGAGGNTAKQMAKGLRLPEDKKVTEEGFSEILNHLKESNDFILRVANKIFVKRGFAINDQFKQSAQKFMAGAEEIDFQEPITPEAINSWVEGITNGRIKNLFGKGAFNQRTLMVLVNAVYFKGNWSRQFNKHDTKRAPFHLAENQEKDVDMMFIKENFMYADIDDLDSQVVLLPYKGDRIAMLIVLPRELNGLRDAEKNLRNIPLQKLMARMVKVLVQVYLPKFKMEYATDLNGPLTKLRMTEMFDDTADFSGISKNRLKVNQVAHKVFIEVNEEGTEAAAATGIIPPVRPALPPPRIIFRADHPFLFYIIDQMTGTVLFTGCIRDPSV